MSVIRLIMCEDNSAVSGRIPSSAISAVLWAVAQGAKSIDSLWKTVEKADPGLFEHFSCNLDNSPLLEGYDDGLLVINWDHCCIESFQAYQPVRYSGLMLPHNGKFLLAEEDPVEYCIGNHWSIIDHHFEESRH